MPIKSNVNKYLQTQIATASPEQLLLMLYDGAVRFLHRGKEGIEAGDNLKAHDYLIKAQRIIIELICSLKKEHAPELAENLTMLYYYIYKQLIRANVEKDIPKIDEALRLLETLRSGWKEAIDSVRNDQASTGSTPKYPLPNSGDSGLSLQG